MGGEGQILNCVKVYRKFTYFKESCIIVLDLHFTPVMILLSFTTYVEPSQVTDVEQSKFYFSVPFYDSIGTDYALILYFFKFRFLIIHKSLGSPPPP